MNTRYDFSDQCGIVTGPASGIGKAVALLLAKSNAGLALVDRDTSGLETVARACEEKCSTAPLAVDADVSKDKDVQRMVEAEEQAQVIAFMLSDSASYLNGACLDSNGGSVML